MKKKIAILGSTGSIGTQALDVISHNRPAFEIVALTANHNASLLIEQAVEFLPEYVVIADPSKYIEVKEALQRLPVNVLSGEDALTHVAGLPQNDIVLAAMVGFSGLLPVFAALQSGKNIALANKETLVVAGALIMDLARRKGCSIYPVDSEHSAIFQCLSGEDPGSAEKIILTASGGPFKGMSREQLNHVTCRDALKHPNWCMGNKVTIDSASLMNKGLEVIEASWLFDMHPDKIEVVIHPQSIIHSMVQFTDGSIKAQMGLPDMRTPIQYALGYPHRLTSVYPRFSFSACNELTFEKPDLTLFRNLSIAFEAIRKGGNLPCIMNAANEIVVSAFLSEKIRFLDMPPIIEKTIEKIPFIVAPTLDDLRQTNAEARRVAEEMVKRQ